MSMRNKRGKLAALLAAVLMVFTGCVRSGVGVTTLENDTGTVEISVGINEKYYESMMAQEGAEDIFDGKETAKLTDGDDSYICMVEHKQFQNLDELKTIPHDVLKALAGKDADVTFTTEDCIYTIHGGDITLKSESEDGYKLTYKDYELSKILRRKLRNTDLLSVKVTADTDHDITAELRCFASRDVDTGYLYRLMGNGFEYVSTVSIRNGDARIPVTESGVYVVTSQALADVTMGINMNSENMVPIVGGKLIPLSAVVDGKLVFRTESYGKLMFSEYTSSYTDIRNHKYTKQIDFVCARGLLDGVDADSFQPNAGITTGEFMRAIARLRGIPDKDAYDYCTQLDIFTYEYVEDDLLSRNEMSVIFTNFINHLIQYPKSFGGYSMSGFDDNGAAWVGARFRELKNNSAVEYDWKENASRAEAAYLLQAAVETIIMGDYIK